MSNETKCCPKCNNVMSAKTRFCDYCGYSFNSSANVSKTTYKPFNDDSNQQPQQNEFCYTYKNLEPVSKSDMELVIKKKVDVYERKFKKLEYSKTCWNWPVFLLILLLGPLGSAVWFFYRKCKKAGTYLLAASIVAFCLFYIAAVGIVKPVETSFTSYVTAYEDLCAEKGEEYVEDFMEKRYGTKSKISLYSSFYREPDENLPESEQKLIKSTNEIVLKTSKISQSIALLNAAYNLITRIFTFVIAVLANGIYKKTCMKKVNDTKAKFPDYPVRLSAQGGTSLGWAFACVGIFIGAIFLFSIIMSLFNSHILLSFVHELL